MRKQIGAGAMLIMVFGLATTIAAYRDDSAERLFAPFRIFGPLLLGLGVLLLALIYLVMRD